MNVQGKLWLCFILQINFLEGYFQIIFDKGGINLIDKKMLSVEQKENEVWMFIDDGTEIAVNTRLGPAGDTFHIAVEGHSTLHY